jgi:hypothetical protein
MIVPVLLLVECIEAPKSGEGSPDEYVVTFRCVMPKDQASSVLFVSRNHAIVGELQLTEGDL